MSNAFFISCVAGSSRRIPVTIPFSPTNVAGLRFQFDASAPNTVLNGGSNAVNNGGVSEWADATGNAGSLYWDGVSASRKPTFKTPSLNLSVSKPGLQFDGVDDFLLQTSTGNTDGQMCIFIVATHLSVKASTNTVIGFSNYVAGGGAYGYLALQDTADGTRRNRFVYNNINIADTTVRTGPNAYMIKAFSGTGTYRANKGSAQTGAFSPFPAGTAMTHLATGAILRSDNPAGIAFGNNEINEILWYNSDVSTQDQNSIFDYLKAKWGTP